MHIYVHVHIDQVFFSAIPIELLALKFQKSGEKSIEA